MAGGCSIQQNNIRLHTRRDSARLPGSIKPFRKGRWSEKPKSPENSSGSRHQSILFRWIIVRNETNIRTKEYLTACFRICPNLRLKAYSYIRSSEGHIVRPVVGAINQTKKHLMTTDHLVQPPPQNRSDLLAVAYEVQASRRMGRVWNPTKDYARVDSRTNETEDVLMRAASCRSQPGADYNQHSADIANRHAPHE